MIAHKEKTRNNCKVYDSTIYYVEGMENEKANIVNRHGTKNRKKAPETKDRVSWRMSGRRPARASRSSTSLGALRTLQDPPEGPPGEGAPEAISDVIPGIIYRTS